MGDNIFKKESKEDIADVVIPIMKLICLHPLIPCEIEFDQDKKQFTFRMGGLIKRILSLIWAIIMTTYISSIFISDIRDSHTATVALSKVCLGTYTIFDLVFLTCFWFDGGKIVEILNMGSSMLQIRVPKRNGLISDKKLSMIACVATVMFVGCFVVVIIIGLVAETTDLCNKFMALTGDEDEIQNETRNDESCGHVCKLFTRSRESLIGGCLLTFWLAGAYSVEFLWVSFLVLMTGWGIYFQRLFYNCVECVDSGGTGIRKGMKAYFTVTALLDQFNVVFGKATFWGVLSLGFYIAFIFGEFMAEGSSGMLVDGINLLSVLPFCTMMWAGAEVHKTTSTLIKSIKRKSVENKCTVKEYLEIMHWTSSVQHDALSYEVGITGLGFFTISYKFIAHLAGLIFTYALVTLQFKRAESIMS